MPRKITSQKLLVAAVLAGLCAAAQISWAQVSSAQGNPNGERTNQREGQSSDIQQNTTHPQGLPAGGNSRLEDTRRTSSGELTLNGDQRTQLKNAVKHAKLKRQENVGFTIAVGAAVPQQANTRDLPPAIAKTVPSKHSLQYVLVRDQLILVDKETRRIVAIVPGMA